MPNSKRSGQPFQQVSRACNPAGAARGVGQAWVPVADKAVDLAWDPVKAPEWVPVADKAWVPVADKAWGLVLAWGVVLAQAQVRALVRAVDAVLERVAAPVGGPASSTSTRTASAITSRAARRVDW